jgi:glycosyltransferase involved in cell wall biosynthesis
MSASGGGAEHQPLVSVVTPFYNTDQYLAQCIESVLSQEYQNWEYILVNNCSTDRSWEIALEYAAAEPRIRLVCTETLLGQVQNYNGALRQISRESKYCKIVQADDWLFPDCLSQMVAVAEAHPAVGIVSSYYLNGTKVLGSGLPYPSTTVAGAEICRWHLRHFPEQYLFGTPTTLLFRSDLVRAREPFYDESSPLEDYEVCFEVLRQSDFGFVHQVLTFLRVEEESLTGQIRDFYPYLLHAFICIKKFGPCYLDEKEYRERLEAIRKRYFEALARGVVQRLGRQFWDYHCDGLRSMGYHLKRMELAKYVLLELLDLARHPKAATRLLARYIA